MGLLGDIIWNIKYKLKKEVVGEAPLKGKPIETEEVNLLPSQKAEYIEYFKGKEEAKDDISDRKYSRKLDIFTTNLNEYLLARGVEEKDLDETREKLLEEARKEGIEGN